MSHDVIYFPSEKCFSDGELVCPMDRSEPSESIFVHRSQIASIGHICGLAAAFATALYTGCIKKMVIELWRAIGHSIFSIQK